MPKEIELQKKKVEKVMHEAKRGEQSGSGKKVTSHRQAATIALHAAGVPQKA